MKKRLVRMPRRRIVPHPKCTVQITLSAYSPLRKRIRSFTGKSSFRWMERNLPHEFRGEIAKFLDGLKFGAELGRRVNIEAEKRDKRAERNARKVGRVRIFQWPRKYGIREIRSR